MCCFTLQSCACTLASMVEAGTVIANRSPSRVPATILGMSLTSVLTAGAINSDNDNVSVVSLNGLGDSLLESGF